VLRAGQVIEDAAGIAPAPQAWWSAGNSAARAKPASAKKAPTKASGGGKPAKKLS
jgi:hypothetical protein